MDYIYLKNLDKKVSQIALGVNKTGNKHSNTEDTVNKRIYFYHKAMDMGINMFDTAELYGGGYSEEILGIALRNRREQAIICSKFNARNSHKKDLQASLNNSLKRLNTDYIDFYLSHWRNPEIPVQELIESLKEFKKQGKIKAYGIGNAVFSEINEFDKKNKNDFFVVENEFNLLQKESLKKVIPFCNKNNHLFLAYSPFLQGKKIKFSPEILSLTTKHNCTIHQLMLAWVLQKNVVSIIRTMNDDHLAQNLKSTKINLSVNDCRTLEQSFGTKKNLINIDDVLIDERCYITFKQAIDNKDDLIPSPQLLAERLKNNFELPPLRTVFKNGKYKILDDYYFSEIKKYWAWKICNRKKIEAFVFNDIS
tara:strand:- start:3102 stop:4199 length:1098 start_codon:yes stop_codon:yes gene_type:complete